jgi:hypothetical protein
MRVAAGYIAKEIQTQIETERIAESRAEHERERQEWTRTYIRSHIIWLYFILNVTYTVCLKVTVTPYIGLLWLLATKSIQHTYLRMIVREDRDEKNVLKEKEK